MPDINPIDLLSLLLLQLVTAIQVVHLHPAIIGLIPALNTSILLSSIVNYLKNERVYLLDWIILSLLAL